MTKEEALKVVESVPRFIESSADDHSGKLARDIRAYSSRVEEAMLLLFGELTKNENRPVIEK